MIIPPKKKRLKTFFDTNDDDTRTKEVKSFFMM